MPLLPPALHKEFMDIKCLHDSDALEWSQREILWHWSEFMCEAGTIWICLIVPLVQLYTDRKVKTLVGDSRLLTADLSSCFHSLCGSSDPENSPTLMGALCILCSSLQHLATAAWQLWPSNHAKHWVTTSRAHPVGPWPLGCINRNQGLTGLRVGAQGQKTHTHTHTHTYMLSLNVYTVYLLMWGLLALHFCIHSCPFCYFIANTTMTSLWKLLDLLCVWSAVVMNPQRIITWVCSSPQLYAAFFCVSQLIVLVQSHCSYQPLSKTPQAAVISEKAQKNTLYTTCTAPKSKQS